MDRFAVLGDLHWGCNPLGKVPNMLERQFDLIDGVCEEIKQNTDLVVLVGDVLHFQVASYEVSSRVVELFKKHSDLEFVWIAGNHDTDSKKMSTINLLDIISEHIGNYAVVLEPELMEWNGFQIGLLPYPYNHVIKGANFSIGHFECYGARWPNGQKIEMEEGKWDRNHYYISGHLHDYHRVENSKTTYIGSPYQTRFDEGKKGRHWALVGFDGDNLIYEKMPIEQDWILDHWIIDSTEDLFKSVEIDDHHFYKVRFNNSTVGVPKGFLADHPNCFIEPVKYKREFSKAQKQNFENSFNVLEGMEEWLKNNSDLNDNQVKQAMEIFNSKVAELEQKGA